MRSIPAALALELTKNINFTCNLVELYLSQTVYYTDLDIDIYHDGHWYLSRGLRFADAEYSISPRIDKTSFEIDNVTKEFIAFILNQEVRGKRCVIKLAGMEGKNEILLNGGFETPGAGGTDVFAGWMETATGNSQITRWAALISQAGVPILSQAGQPILAQSSVGERMSYRGNYCCHFYHDSPENYAQVLENITLTPNKRYRLRLTYKTSPGKQANFLLTRQEWSTIELKLDGTWGELSNGITLPEASIFTTVEIEFSGHPDYQNYTIALRTEGYLSAGGHIWWDDVSIIPLDAPPAKIAGAANRFVGIIGSAEGDEKRVRFEIYSPFVYWRRKIPRRIHQPTCDAVFKGEDGRCGYTGTQEECDQTWERCAALNNILNFRGFRWLPALEGKKIWWGRSPM